MPRLSPASLLPLALVALAACGTASSTTTAGPTSSPGSTRTVTIDMLDSMRYSPASVTVPRGENVTFVLRNVGTVQHEFVLGDQAAQDAHEKEMMTSGGISSATSGGGMGSGTMGSSGMSGGAMASGAMASGAMASGGMPGGHSAMSVAPGHMQMMTQRFDTSGVLMYGCHTPGHWNAGMRGTLTIQ